MINNQDYAIETYGNGFIVADYSGDRGKCGAAYAGRDGIWRDQPVGLEPFRDKQAAELFANGDAKSHA